MAAQVAGQDPDEHLRLKLGDVVAFDAVMWRYPDFLARAEAAYDALTSVSLPQPASSDGHDHSFANQANITRPDSEIHSRDA